MSNAKIGLILICILSLSGAVYVSLNASNVSLLYLFLLPLILIGDGLRALSLSSTIGNIAAIIFYVILSLLPLSLALIHKFKGKKLLKSDSLLVLISASTFAVLYLFINPQIIPSLFNSFISADKSMLESEKILIAVVYLSIWAAFLASWLLRAYKKDNLIANIEKLLYAFAVICIVFICYTNASELITFITKAYAASTASISDSPFGMPSGTTPAADIFLALIRLASRIIPIILALSMLLLANFLAGDHKLYKENQLFI